jgi:hypothetical protein
LTAGFKRKIYAVYSQNRVIYSGFPEKKVIPIPEKIPPKNRFFYQVLSHVKVRFAGPEK